MKRKTFIFLLVAEAALCLALNFAGTIMQGAVTTGLAFPFEQIALGLRALSLSGGVGNGVAIVLYLAVCLAPLVWILLRKPRKLLPEDALLALLCGGLFWVIYHMINPGLMTHSAVVGGGLAVAKALMGGAVYSVLCAYIVLQVLRRLFSAGLKQLQRYMMVLLHLLNVIFVYAVFGSGVSALGQSIAALQASNTGNEHLLGTSYLFLVLQHLVNMLPYALNIVMVFGAIRLLHQLRQDKYSQQTIDAAHTFSRLCVACLVITVSTIALLNILQLFMARFIYSINGQLVIPVFSIVFVLAALLLSRLVIENKALRDDSDSII